MSQSHQAFKTKQREIVKARNKNAKEQKRKETKRPPTLLCYKSVCDLANFLYIYFLFACVGRMRLFGHLQIHDWLCKMILGQSRGHER